MKRDPPPNHGRASQRQEVNTERNYLLELVVVFPRVVVNIGDAVIRILLQKEKDIKLSL